MEGDKLVDIKRGNLWSQHYGIHLLGEVFKVTHCKKKHDRMEHFQKGAKWFKSHGGEPEKACGLEPVKVQPSCLEDRPEIENP